MKKKGVGAALVLAGLIWAGGASAQQPAPVSVLAGNCVGCHGIDGVSRGPASPTIAGLSKPYFVSAMLAYKYGNDRAKIEAAARTLKIDPDDLSAFERPATVMDRMATGYSDEEIGILADYFAGKTWVPALQAYDARLAARGQQVHDDACEKCHENGGRKGDEGEGVLAGQWMPYLNYTFADYNEGHRGMPKKMRARMKELDAADFQALLHFYASQK